MNNGSTIDTTPTYPDAQSSDEAGLMVRRRRVGIMTFHFVPNYGAIWQVWALQRFLELHGYDATVIDYRPRHVIDGGRFWVPTSLARLRANVIIAYQRYCAIRNLFGRRRVVREHFRDFERHWLRLTPRRYATLSELRKDPPQADALVCGSDQIWNPSPQFGFDDAYFLDFGSDGVRRISYAASFGRSQIESESAVRLKSLMARLDAISVREASGIEILKTAGFDGGVTHVLDPTLLLDGDEYPRSPPALAQQPYIFSYVLRGSGGLAALQRQVAHEAALPVYAPLNMHHGKRTADIEVLSTPEEWQGYIRGAAYVLTNSFHGTVFSILHRRQFLVVGLEGPKAALNDRAFSLLADLGLSDRVMLPHQAADAYARLKDPIDWQAVNRRLTERRACSTAFLLNALSASKSASGRPR